MARRPRIDLPHIPQHVVQQGHDRQPCFFGHDDYEAFLVVLREALLKHGAQLHAYCLMTNHTHLPMTPLEPGAISGVLQAASSQFVRLINGRYRRSGTLWEGRFKGRIEAMTQHRVRPGKPGRPCATEH